MTAFPVMFYGGPLAGQVHAIDDPPTRWRVPSYTRVRVTEAESARPVSYDVEEYELGPGYGEHRYVYTWINPADVLRKRISFLEDEWAREKVRASRLEREKAALQKDANRWKTIQGALRTLKAEL